MKDKYKALWVSHSSIGDFINCPRSYYLRAVYKNPKTGHKFTIIKPPLAMGQAVHAVIEEISYLPSEKRLDTPLSERLKNYWLNISGKKGGFSSESQENDYRQRAEVMLQRITDHPQIINKPAVKIKIDGGLPYYWLSEDENIILCGKIDWISYLPENDSLHIIDFKTGKNEENENSLQLPIYFLLASNLQKRKIEKMSYWYLFKNEEPQEVLMPDIKKAFKDVLVIAQRMKLGRQINYFKCPNGGCFFCEPLERVLNGEGELVGESEYHQDIYYLP